MTASMWVRMPAMNALAEPNAGVVALHGVFDEINVNMGRLAGTGAFVATEKVEVLDAVPVHGPWVIIRCRGPRVDSVRGTPSLCGSGAARGCVLRRRFAFQDAERLWMLGGSWRSP